MWASNPGGLIRGKEDSRQAKGWRPGVGFPHAATFCSGALRSLRNHLEPGHPLILGGYLSRLEEGI